MGCLSRFAKARKANAILARRKLAEKLTSAKLEGKHSKENIPRIPAAQQVAANKDLCRLITSFNDDIFPDVRNPSVKRRWASFLRQHKDHFRKDSTKALTGQYLVRLFDEDPTQNGGIYFGKVIKRNRNRKHYLVVFDDGDCQSILVNDIILGLFDSNHIPLGTKERLDSIVDSKQWTSRMRLKLGQTDVDNIAPLMNIM
jgi:hypothetical protein